MKTLTATEIIKNRDFLTHSMAEDWKKIQLTNVINKNETPMYNCKAIIENIKKMSQERITYKLYAQAINMGYKDFCEFPATSLYSVIYEISEINSLIVQIGLIPTINPTLKLKKGKASLSKKEDITAAYKTKLINELSKRKLVLEQKRDEFNNKATLIIESNIPSSIAA